MDREPNSGRRRPIVPPRQRLSNPKKCPYCPRITVYPLGEVLPIGLVTREELKTPSGDPPANVVEGLVCTSCKTYVPNR